MELEKQLRILKEQSAAEAKEEKISETIRKSKELFLLNELGESVHYFEFLMTQFHLIRKRWWVLQALMLGLVSVFLSSIQNRDSVWRILGVIGVLFVVLIIPEFWKNKSSGCMQIEGTCLYSLRQIYTARIIWFGMADMLLLTCFCITICGESGLLAGELLVQFLFPMLVAACICFGTLCSNTPANEGTAILLCLLWNAVWCFIILNETVYKAITFPIWCALFGFFVVFLAGAVYKTIHDCNMFWEVDYSGITNG